MGLLKGLIAMDAARPMPLLLIEDNPAECMEFVNCVRHRTDIRFVGLTGSGFEGLRLLKSRRPECVILDLELKKGTGSGLQFLADLRNERIMPRPIVVVTTNSASELVYDHVHDNGADLVFFKRQADYSPEMVIGTLLALRKFLRTVRYGDIPDDLRTAESPEERRARILERIDVELDLIGIDLRYKGRTYLRKAIFLLLTKEKNTSDAVFYQVASDCKTAYSSVIRAVQTAINRAWDNSGIEDLQAHYTARISIHTGVPSPTEFIHYYAHKIRRSI